MLIPDPLRAACGLTDFHGFITPCLTGRRIVSGVDGFSLVAKLSNGVIVICDDNKFFVVRVSCDKNITHHFLLLLPPMDFRRTMRFSGFIFLAMIQQFLEEATASGLG
jgi:hypothetical protein